MDTLALDAPEDQTQPAEPGGPERIVLGLAGHVADRLGIDPLWVRLTFVVLGLVGGAGVFVYVGLWLVLGAAAQDRARRLLGGAAVLVGAPLTITTFETPLFGGTFSVIALLFGLGMSLWYRGGERVAVATLPASSAVAASPRRLHLPTLPRREPSLLGRGALAASLVVGSVWGLADALDGGRLHPEQWLGAAAMVCGVGLLVGTVRGRARWLVLPAAVFAAAAYPAGVVARLDIAPVDWGGISYFSVTSSSPVPAEPVELRAALDDVFISASGDLPELATVDARSAFGDIYVTVEQGAVVEVRPRVDDGTVWINSTPINDEVIRVGGEGEPDMVVDAWAANGDIWLTDYDDIRIEEPSGPALPEGAGPLTQVSDGVAVTSDGWVVLGDGEAVIGPGGVVASGNGSPYGDGSTSFMTAYGEFRLLPRSLLMTPSSEILDLQAIREELGALPVPFVLPVPSVPPEEGEE